jgi:hypothetical protein
MLGFFVSKQQHEHQLSITLVYPKVRAEVVLASSGSITDDDTIPLSTDPQYLEGLACVMFTAIQRSQQRCTYPDVAEVPMASFVYKTTSGSEVSTTHAEPTPFAPASGIRNKCLCLQ